MPRVLMSSTSLPVGSLHGNAARAREAFPQPAATFFSYLHVRQERATPVRWGRIYVSHTVTSLCLCTGHRTRELHKTFTIIHII